MIRRSRHRRHRLDVVRALLHFRPTLRTVAPGESVVVRLQLAGVAAHPETARLKIDLVAELRCWFEDVGSPPLVIDVSSVQ